MKDKRFVSAGRMGECFKIPSPLFRPIVASSLVLALSASAANAQTCTDTDPADKPIFCYADGGSASPHTMTADKDSRNIGDRERTGGIKRTIYEGDVTLKSGIWIHQGEKQTIFKGNATIQSGDEVIYAGYFKETNH
ncbi:hypothetical protein [Helicobacter pametensis]|uniref:hypothetical protein n=1 Tax=Helicobacter pametensis TaxID=95149 RepID=UPI0004851758|nr:hypothetical protein [Helicobacter pametensis]